MIVRGMRDIRTPDYYDILQLSPSASESEIKTRYRLLSKRHHPDMGGSQEDMAKLNEAYDVLSDQFRRTIYDAERRRSLRVPPRAPAQPAYTSPRRQPAPRPEPQFTAYTRRRKRSGWWSFLAWSFAVAIIVGGIIIYLPVSQANSALGSPSATTSSSSQQNIGYQPSSGASSTSTSSSTPSAINGGAPTTATTNSNNSNVSSSDTCASDTTSQTDNCYAAQTSCADDSSCPAQSTQPQKNCTTKTFGQYRHVVCAAPNGSNRCTNTSVGATYRYTSCY